MRISDWSSDVCSSDLAVKFRREGNIKDGRILERQIARMEDEQASSVARAFSYFLHLSNIAEDRDQNRRQRQHELHAQAPMRGSLQHALDQIGRASCRERVCQYV